MARKRYCFSGRLLFIGIKQSNADNRSDPKGQSGGGYALGHSEKPTNSQSQFGVAETHPLALGHSPKQSKKTNNTKPASKPFISKIPKSKFQIPNKLKKPNPLKIQTNKFGII